MAFINYIPENEKSCFENMCYFRRLWSDKRTFTDDNIDKIRHYLALMYINQNEKISDSALAMLGELDQRAAYKMKRDIINNAIELESVK